MIHWFAHTYQKKVTFDSSALTQHFILPANRDRYSIATLTPSAHKKNISEIPIFNTLSSCTPVLYPCFIKESKEHCKTQDSFLQKQNQRKNTVPQIRTLFSYTISQGFLHFNFFMLWQ